MSTKIKDFTARRNPGLKLAFLDTLYISSMHAELMRYEKMLPYGGHNYEVQGDIIALCKLAPCQILVSFQSYKTGEKIAVFKIKDTPENGLPE